jgi:hypothetical protein
MGAATFDLTGLSQQGGHGAGRAQIDLAPKN